MDFKELVDMLWDLHMEAYGKWSNEATGEHSSSYWAGKAEAYLELYEMLGVKAK